MQETFQIVLFIISGTIILVGFSAFVIFSALQYRKAKRIHELEKAEMKNLFEKEVLEVKVEVQEETLNFVSEEIHDNIGQILSLAKMNVSGLKTSENEKKVDNASELLNTAISDLRGLSHILSENKLDDSEILQLVEQLVADINKAGRMTAELNTLGLDSMILGKKKTLVLFRIIQEVVNNSLKYSDGTELLINLEYSASYLKISISDDGKGFDYESLKTVSNGLLNIKRRSEMINAQLDYKSIKNKGTFIKLELEANNEED